MWFFYFIRYSVSFYFCCISASILYSMCLSISRYYCVAFLPLFYIEGALLFLAISVFYLCLYFYLSVRLFLSSIRVSRSQECLKTVVANSVQLIILSFYISLYVVSLISPFVVYLCLTLVLIVYLFANEKGSLPGHCISFNVCLSKMFNCSYLYIAHKHLTVCLPSHMHLSLYVSSTHMHLSS